MKKIIIQGDDLAYKPEVDLGIAYAYEQGILTSTTVMANLIEKKDKSKYSEFLEGLENKSGLDKPRLGIGVYLNVTFGKPLSPNWPQPEFTRPHKGTGLPEEWQGSGWKKYLSQFTADQAKSEYKRQIERAMEVFGGRIDHLDSHQFAASYSPFKEIYEELAMEYSLPVRPDMPLSENPVYGGDFVFDTESIDKLRKRGIKVADTYITKLFFNEADPIGSFVDCVEEVKGDITAEIMFHPAKGEDAEDWRLKDLEILTNNNVIELFKNEAQLISYSDL